MRELACKARTVLNAMVFLTVSLVNASARAEVISVDCHFSGDVLFKEAKYNADTNLRSVQIIAGGVSVLVRNKAVYDTTVEFVKIDKRFIKFGQISRYTGDYLMDKEIDLDDGDIFDIMAQGAPPKKVGTCKRVKSAEN